MILIVHGERSLYDYEFVSEELDKIRHTKEIDTIYTTDSRGCDTSVARYCVENNVQSVIFAQENQPIVERMINMAKESNSAKEIIYLQFWNQHTQSIGKSYMDLAKSMIYDLNVIGKRWSYADMSTDWCGMCKRFHSHHCEKCSLNQDLDNNWVGKE